MIVEADGDQLEQDGDLATAILDKEPGDTVTLKIIRDGKTEDVDVTLGDRNDAESG